MVVLWLPLYCFSFAWVSSICYDVLFLICFVIRTYWGPWFSVIESTYACLLRRSSLSFWSRFFAVWWKFLVVSTNSLVFLVVSCDSSWYFSALCVWLKRDFSNTCPETGTEAWRAYTELLRLTILAGTNFDRKDWSFDSSLAVSSILSVRSSSFWVIPIKFSSFLKVSKSTVPWVLNIFSVNSVRFGN